MENNSEEKDLVTSSNNSSSQVASQSFELLNIDGQEFIEPIPFKANDRRVLVHGNPITEDFRIIAEGQYQRLLRKATAAQASVATMPSEGSDADFIKRNSWNKSQTVRQNEMNAGNQE